MTKSQIAFSPPHIPLQTNKMIYLIPIALFCVLNSANANELQCENGNCTYSDETTTSIDSTTFNDILSKANQKSDILTLTIDTPQATLTGTGSNSNQFLLGDEANWYSFTINARNITITNNDKDNKYNAKITANQKSTINANLDITNSHLQVMKSTQYGFDGGLTINGNFTAKDSNIQNATTDTERGQFIVSGKSTITGSTFIVYSLSELSNARVKALMLTSNGGFNNDITTSNTAQFKIRVDTTMLEDKWGKFLDPNSTEIGAPIGGDDGVVDKVFNTVLKLEGSNLYAVKEIGNKSFKDLALANIKMDLDTVNAEISRFGENYNGGLSKNEQTKLKALKEIIETKYKADENKSEADFEREYNEKNGNQSGSIALSATTATNKDLVGATIASDLFFNNGDGAVKETIDLSTQIAEDGGQSQSVTAQNMQSEMATTTRMAKFSNPYAKVYYAQNTMTTQRALNGDIRSDVPLTPYFTTNELLNNLWANLFGGANIIGGNVGEIYGLNAGYDRRIGAHFLGGYVSYAYATMKDSHINQTTHNIQAGLYSRLVFGKNEIDIKLSAQAGITKQNRYVVNLSNDAHFTRAFMGLNGSYGYVFKMGKGVFLKPMLGVNFYFSYTPKYSEKGDLAQTIQAMSSTNLSVDIGADLRAYWNEDSFFYIVPKFEQYVLTQNDDFVGAFVGSPNNFRITAQNKLKTYFQGIIGVDIGVYQGLAITLSGGVKQIISEHIDSRNEIFISGNLGVKYRF